MRKKSWLLYYLFLLSTILLAGAAYSQTFKVSGTVVNKSGVPIDGVSVRVQGKSTGAITNVDGLFSITAKPGDVLVFSAVNYKDVMVKLGKTNDHLAINMENRESSLDEVVVTGYSRVNKTQFTGAASVISAKAVNEVPVGAFDQALQGHAPGLLVNSGSGQPGTSANVTIRGVRSIQGAGAQPLYVIDGVPVAAQDFQTLNPDDFESLTVLKDASAAALYGARGGTGVIVITTKRGKAGKTTITARSQLGFTEAPNFSRLNLMNTKEMLGYEERMGQILGSATTPNTPGWIYSKNNPTYATLSPAQQSRYDFMLDSIGKINSDWSKILYRKGFSQMHEISVNGGNDNTKIYLSAGVFDQKGIDLKAALRRYTTRFNIDHTTGNLSISWNNLIGYSVTNLSEGEALGNSARNPFQMTYRAKTYENPYKPDGTLNYGANTTLALKQIANVLEGIENSSLVQKQLKINSGLTLAYKILPSLTAKNVFGIDYSSNVWQRYINPASYVGSTQPFQSGIDVEAYNSVAQLINTSSLTFAKRINNVHDLEVGAYFEAVRGYGKGLGFTLYNLDPRLSQTGQGAGPLPTNGASTYPQNATSAKSGFGIRSFFGLARYTYNDKYTLSANIRRDGTSRIVNISNREITTWSVGGIWNAIKENFMQQQHVLSDLKVRASYGVVPNIGSIPTSSYVVLGTSANNWVTVTNYQGPQVPSFGTNQYAGSPLTGLAPTSPGNPNLKIENVQEADLGVDFALLHNRIRVTVDAYHNKTVDLFVNQPLSGTTGFSSLSINAGTMVNKGFEFTVSGDVIKNNDMTLTIGLNHAINNNKITDLGSVSEYPLGTFLIKKGLPYGTHYTPHYLGADPQTGMPKFETATGITNDAASAPQYAKFGTYLPKHVGGINLDFTYKGFSIGALFSYQFDVVRSNNIRNWITRGTPGYQASVNGSRELLTNQWRKPGDNAFYQSPAYDRGFTSSDLENARFLRFRNLNVGYQFSNVKFSGKTIFKSIRVYVQGQNLAVWSPWHGLDPEDDNNISLNEYPNPRTFVGGIDITL